MSGLFSLATQNKVVASKRKEIERVAGGRRGGDQQFGPTEIVATEWA